MLADLKIDSALISKTKLYKEDLLDYRNTYDKFDDVDISSLNFKEEMR